MNVHYDRALLLYQQRHELAEGELLLDWRLTRDNPMALRLLALCLCHRKDYPDATLAKPRWLSTWDRISLHALCPGQHLQTAIASRKRRRRSTRRWS